MSRSYEKDVTKTISLGEKIMCEINGLMSYTYIFTWRY